MDYRKLKLYWIDMKYIRDLQNADKRVYSVSPQVGKQNRPYLGIIVLCGKQKYCVPLTTPKSKHDNMKDKIDFTKIMVEGDFIAAINFSRMIPVEDGQLSKVDTKIRKHDNARLKERKALLSKELMWCNEHYEEIVNKANVLYNKYKSGDFFKRKKDCLNFIKLEMVCDTYKNKNQQTYQ